MSNLGSRSSAYGFIKFDPLTFDGVTSTFTLTRNGSPYAPASAVSSLLVLNGVLQEPYIDYNISSSSLTFDTAPPLDSDFFGISIGERIIMGAPADGSVTGASISGFVPLSKGGTGVGTVPDILTLLGLSLAAKLDTAQDFSAPQRSAPATDNDLSFALNLKQNFGCTPSAPGVLTFTGINDGQSGYIILINTAGHLISADSSTKISLTDLARISTAGTYRIDYATYAGNVYVSVTGSYT